MVAVGSALGGVVGWVAGGLTNVQWGPADARGLHPLGKTIMAAGGGLLGALIAAGYSAKYPAPAPCPQCPPCPPPQTIYVQQPAPQNT
jgi:hypothetical protein